MNKSQLQPGFPATRLRRMRRSPILREMFRETSLHASDFIYPLFIVEGENVKKEISSMPGQFQLSIDNVINECEELATLGVNSVLLFGIPAEKAHTRTTG
jgi:porphobilinogen synthase